MADYLSKVIEIEFVKLYMHIAEEERFGWTLHGITRYNDKYVTAHFRRRNKESLSVSSGWS